MYRKKSTKSFFETGGDDAKSAHRSFQRRDKENLPGKDGPERSDTRESISDTRESISDTTLSRLNAFALPRGSGIVDPKSRTPKKDSTNLSSSQQEEAHPRSSQVEDRVRWKISPPPANHHGNSTQKLTINEMFDIYQASQHSSETPIRHLDPAGDLWSRYDSAEPLPYLDLELSPGHDRGQKSDGKLRRTTSLPTWSADKRDRKRRKYGNIGGPEKTGGRVRGMMERIQHALSHAGSPETAKLPLRNLSADQQSPHKSASTPIEHNHVGSDDFGDDDLDEAMLLALPELQTPMPQRSTSNPLPLPVSSIPLISHEVSLCARTGSNDSAQPHGRPANGGSAALACKESTHSAEVLHKPEVQGAKSPAASSNYSMDFEAEDFLAASQLHLPTELRTGARDYTANSRPESQTALLEERNLTPAELLQGLDEDAFSDFDEPIESGDNAVFSIRAMQTVEPSSSTARQPYVLLVLRKDTGQVRHARLYDSWADLSLSINDEVRLLGSWEPSGIFLATDQQGLIIVHPDVLDRVRATSMLSKALLYGSMIHAILQNALFKGDFEDSEVRKEIARQVESNMEKLFLVEEDPETAKDYLFSKVMLLQQWAVKFVGKEKFGQVEPMRGKTHMQQVAVGVRDVSDIEERFWSPQYGLKGNVDVTAQFNVSIDDQQTVVTAPLEFKTGKSEYQQTSHRAQVLLYTLLMSERYGINVSAGFLYYLESGQITRVASLHKEIRGLLITRNELARHLKHKSLPPMIADKRLCKGCYASDACFTYHKCAEAGDGDSSGLGELFQGRTAHLGKQDTEFFIKWESLITKEEGEMFRFRNELWHLTSEQRQKMNRCFGDLLVVPGSETFDPTHGKMYQWTYQLKRAEPGASFLLSQISNSEPVIVSDESGHYAISCGFVSAVTATKISVKVDRPLRDSRAKLDDFDSFTNQVFRGIQAADNLVNPVRYRVDQDEFKSGMGIVRNNLIALLLDPASPNASINTERLRNLIVNLVEPKFDKGRPSTVVYGGKDSLNVDQIRAKDKIMSAKDYALILGMPGTGKTTTIAHIIKALVDAGKSVLLTSYTHSAVDTIILKLASDKMKVLRLGGITKIHPEVLQMAMTEQHNCATFEELHDYYNSPSIVATTCLSINHAIFQKRRFDYCIFDEASQATLPVCIGPLRFADKFILVGDHYQLPPLVKDPEARKDGLDVSLFKLLCEAHPSAVVELQQQYRMNADIMSISNRLIYGNRLVCGTRELETKKLSGVTRARLSALHLHNRISRDSCGHSGSVCWLDDIIDPDRRVVYLNTDFIPEAREEKTHDQIINRAESTLVTHIVEGLAVCGVSDHDIGVISPYRSQLKVIQHGLSGHPGVIVDTADKFQGRDKECTIISLVRSNDSKNIGELLKDWRRINVAFTRAKSKLIIIGSQGTLANDFLLNTFLHLVHERGWAYDLPAKALQLHVLPLGPSQASGSNVVDRVSQMTNVASGRERQTKISMAGARVVQNNRPILRDVMNAM